MTEDTDTFRRIRKGDIATPMNAETVNALTEVASRVQRGGMYPKEGARELDGGREDETTVLLKNTTDYDIDQFGVMAIGDTLILPTDSYATFAERRAFKGIDIAADVSFAIAQKPLPKGDGGEGTIGEAVILGVTPCLLNVVDAGHTFAAPTTSRTELTTGGSGPAKILWKESGTGSGKRAVVMLTGLTSGGSDPDADWNVRGYVGAPDATPAADDPQYFGGKKSLLTGSSVRDTNDPGDGGGRLLYFDNPTDVTQFPMGFPDPVGSGLRTESIGDDDSYARFRMLQGATTTTGWWTGQVATSQYLLADLALPEDASAGFDRGNVAYSLIDLDGYVVGGTYGTVDLGEPDTVAFVGGLYVQGEIASLADLAAAVGSIDGGEWA